MATDASLASLSSYSRLLSLAVHEFRTPASVVGGYLRMLQRDTDPALSRRQRKMVDEAEKAYARLVALVNELSDVSKIDDGTAVFKDEPFDVFELVDEVAKEMHEAEERDVVLQPSGEVSGARMVGDRTRVGAAFSAFCRAILREQPGPVTVAVDRRLAGDADKLVAMVVIARESDVQQSYKAPTSAFDELRGGLGLALPVARRIVERHGGRVWAPAVAEAGTNRGRGAVAVSFPLSMRERRQ
jgi:signal transduction histidine kinase